MRLTNLDKPFWPELGITKGDLLHYYADVSRRAAAAPARPRDGDEALPARRGRGVLLHEARADAAAGRGSRPARSSTSRATSSTSRSSRTCAVAAVGRQPRLHRPEPVVRAVRRRRPPGLPALRPRPGPRRDVRAGARGRARSSATRSRRSACPATRRRPARAAFTSTSRSSAGRRRSRCGRSPRRSRRRWPHRSPTLITAEYSIAKRPQGRVLVDYNQNAWGRTLASVYSVRPKPGRDGVDAGDVEGDRERRHDRAVPPEERARPGRAKCGDLWTAAAGEDAAGSTSRSSSRAKLLMTPADPDRRIPPMEAKLRRRDPRRAAAGSTSRSGTASAASRSATATRSSCSRRRASRWRATSRRSSRRCGSSSPNASCSTARSSIPVGAARLVRSTCSSASTRPRAASRSWRTRRPRSSSSSTCSSTSGADRSSSEPLATSAGSGSKPSRAASSAKAERIRLSPGHRRRRGREAVARSGGGDGWTASSPSGST